MSWNRLSTEPRASVGDSYVEHRGVPRSFAGPFRAAGCAALFPPFLPSLFLPTASTTVKRLHARMMNRRPHPVSPGERDGMVAWDPVI